MKSMGSELKRIRKDQLTREDLVDVVSKQLNETGLADQVGQLQSAVKAQMGQLTKSVLQLQNDHTATAIQVDTLAERIDILETQPAAMASSEPSPEICNALRALRAGVESALRGSNSTIVLLSNWSTETQEVRRAKVDEICKELKLRPKSVTTDSANDKPTPYTQVTFEAVPSVQRFIKAWIAAKVRNIHDAPVYARVAVDKALRQIRKPLVEAEKAIKKYYVQRKEKHEFRINWATGVLTIDKIPKVELTDLLTLRWLDEDLYTAICTVESAPRSSTAATALDPIAIDAPMT